MPDVFNFFLWHGMLERTKSRQFEAMSPGYVADHWCSKGHIIFCVDGELVTDLKDGRSFTLKPGMSYQVADDDGQHRSHTDKGARLFIVD